MRDSAGRPLERGDQTGDTRALDEASRVAAGVVDLAGKIESDPARRTRPGHPLVLSLDQLPVERVEAGVAHADTDVVAGRGRHPHLFDSDAALDRPIDPLHQCAHPAPIVACELASACLNWADGVDGEKCR